MKSGYVFATITFWGGISSLLYGQSELKNALYCLINFAMALTSVLVQRTTLLVFASIGILVYIGHIAGVLFSDSILFPFVLSGLGIGLIVLGVWLKKQYPKIEAFIHRILS